MKRTDIIQSLIDKVGAENYLEVGVSAGENFRDIKCKNKVVLIQNHLLLQLFILILIVFLKIIKELLM